METKFYHILSMNDAERKELKGIVENGGVIAFPTETVYGLGCLIDHEESIDRLYSLKNRPESKAFTLHLGNMDQLPGVAEIAEEKKYSLINHFCPGPITFVIPKNKKLSKRIGTEDSVGVRIPAHDRLCELISFFEKPLVGTSANLSSQPPARDIEEVITLFDGKIDAIIDGGKIKSGTPSTVVDILKEPFKILRQGDITLEEINAIYDQKQPVCSV